MCERLKELSSFELYRLGIYAVIHAGGGAHKIPHPHLSSTLNTAFLFLPVEDIFELSAQTH